jgi:hypothetical protein
MAITLELWQLRLAAYLAAEIAVLQNQEYEIDTGNGRRRLKRADLAEIRKGIAECNNAIASLTPSARRRTRYIVPDNA